MTITKPPYSGLAIRKQKLRSYAIDQLVKAKKERDNMETKRDPNEPVKPSGSEQGGGSGQEP